MKNKWIVETSQQVTETPYFKIGSYNVFLCEDSEINAITEKRYDFSIQFSVDIDAIDIFTTLQSSETLTLLKDTPFELHTLVEKYENDVRYKQSTLFLDMQKRYVIPYKVDFISNNNNVDLVFLAYNTYGNEAELVIKAFSYEALYAAYEAIIKELGKVGSINSIEFIKHIKTIKLDELKVDQRKNYYCTNAERLLAGSLRHSNEYAELFKILMKDGYVDRDYKDKLELVLPKDGSFLKLMSTMNKVLLLPLENARHQMLHDSVPHNIPEDDDKTVYTLNPRIWQYFMNCWFEEYVGKALEVIKFDKSFEIDINYECGGEYNFHESNNIHDKTEIDWIVTIRKNTNFKLIFIECKRTLSKRNIRTIKDKWEKKLLNTKNYNFADSLISLGYFTYKDNLNEKSSLSTFSGCNIPISTFGSTNFDILVNQLKIYFQSIIETEDLNGISLPTTQDQTA